MVPKELVSDFYRVLAKLPNFAKVMAVTSVVILFCAINTPVPKVPYLHCFSNSLVEKDGKLYFNRKAPDLEKDEVPDFYVNTRKDPKAGDYVQILYPNGTDDAYLFKLYEGRASYEARVEALKKYLQAEKRGKLYLSFLMSASIALVSYPGLIRRMADLVKGWKVMKRS